MEADTAKYLNCNDWCAARNMKNKELNIPERITVVCSSIPEIRYYARSFTLGSEQKMVNSFLQRTFHIISKSNSKYKVMVFLEPRLDSGYPDIVVIWYDRKAINKRRKYCLTAQHYKVLYEINKHNSIKVTKLAELLGYEEKNILPIIETLEGEGLVLTKPFSVCRVPYKEYYCIKKIVSYEAKLDKWSIAVEQALHNTRFSNESYILMNKDSCSSAMIERCSSLGIGIILFNGDAHCELKASKTNKPGSYVNFVINDWVSQIDNMGECSDN